MKKGESKLSPWGLWSNRKFLSEDSFGNYPASLNATVVRPNLHNLAILNTTVRFHSDKFGSLKL